MKQVLIMIVGVSLFFIFTIAGMISIISYLIGDAVHIQSWISLFLFATGTFFWIVPVHFLDLLRFIPIQRRHFRVIYPYFLNLVQVCLFVFYVIGLNETMDAVSFSNIGLIIFAIVMIVYTKLWLTYIERLERNIRRAR